MPFPPPLTQTSETLGGSVPKVLHSLSGVMANCHSQTTFEPEKLLSVSREELQQTGRGNDASKCREERQVPHLLLPRAVHAISWVWPVVISLLS